MSETMLAIDGNSLMHRAYWALPIMNDINGRPTNAVYGFFMMLFRIVEEYKPQYIAVAFDMHEKTFRHDTYAEYKAGRRKTPEDLNQQFDILKDALSMAGVKYVEKAGFEADDIVGTISKMPGIQTYIFTGDRDELQLISDRTFVVLTKKGVTETALMTRETLKENMGITPAQVVELKGLMGDASDNIPGVPGVGEKTALKLLSEYDSVEKLYDSIDELPKNKMREKLIAGRDSAFMSRELATIDTAVPLSEKLEDFSFGGFTAQKLAPMFEKYGFKAFMKRFGLTAEEEKKHVEKVSVGLDGLKVLEGAAQFSFVLDDGGFAFTADGETEYIIPVKRTLIDEGESEEDILKAASPYFNAAKIICHDVKSFMHDAKACGIRISDYYDIMLADWVLNPSRSKYGLDDIMKREQMEAGAVSLWQLMEKQRRAIKEASLEFILDEVEMPLVSVLYGMEDNGFYVDKDELNLLGEKYEAKLKELTAKIYELAGTEFNIGSTKQLAEVLFEKLKLPVIKKTKTGYSTDIEVLEKLESKHEIIGNIMEYRTLSKLKGTYVDGLVSLISRGYIHTTFLQTATATGRLSSVEPNLQNIPIRSELANDIRRAFAAPEETVIVSADYSQIELRILAHIADDENMKRAFLHGEDIHARTAAEILGKDIKDISREERSNAKAVNFGIVYGISDFGLARNTGISREEAARYIERYFEEFDGVKRYMEEIKQKAHADGFVRTMFGRIRYIPELSSGNFNQRSAGERAALNTPIQGTAADIMKIAMIDAAKSLGGMASRLVLQVHDELIVYAALSEEDEVKRILRESMEGAASLSVPLVVNVASGATWLEAK